MNDSVILGESFRIVVGLAERGISKSHPNHRKLNITVRPVSDLGVWRSSSRLDQFAKQLDPDD
ncbi:MAG: hypothetical protein GTN74_03040 [Proteobacteria bacterium]|nr:hypothetical protein [Pseudomonadota bacterium]